MQTTLTTPQSAPVAAPPAEHPIYQLLRAEQAGPVPAEHGTFRFWACAHGVDGRSRTMAVWGLWLDQTVVFAADTEGVAAGDPRVFPASVIQVEGDGGVRIVDGNAERLEDPALLARFASACEAKYGFEPDPDDPDTPVFAVRPDGVDREREPG
jgi:hypothetical protein